MGVEIVRAAALAGASVVLSCRIAEECEATVERLRHEVGMAANLATVTIDLTSFSSIRAGAASVLAMGGVDTLVHNAGCTGCDTTTVDGFVAEVQINHIGPALLTRLLLGSLRRVVSVASANAYGPIFLPDNTPAPVTTSVDLISEWVRNSSALSKKYFGFYSLSKFLSVQYAHELARRLASDGITSFAVNPGFSRVNVSLPCPREIGFRPCPQHPAQGAMGVVFAALMSGGEMDAASGSLFDYATTLAPPKWVQSGPSCVPRPLPGWLTAAESRPWDDSERSSWFDRVQAWIS